MSAWWFTIQKQSAIGKYPRRRRETGSNGPGHGCGYAREDDLHPLNHVYVRYTKLSRKTWNVRNWFLAQRETTRVTVSRVEARPRSGKLRSRQRCVDIAFPKTSPTVRISRRICTSDREYCSWCRNNTINRIKFQDIVVRNCRIMSVFNFMFVV